MDTGIRPAMTRCPVQQGIRVFVFPFSMQLIDLCQHLLMGSGKGVRKSKKNPPHSDFFYRTLVFCFYESPL